MLVYGQSDVFYPHAKSLTPGTEKRNTYCVGETFEVKETGTHKFRHVRLQGKLRVYAGYGQKAAVRKINKQKQEKMTRTYLWKGNHSDGWTFGEVMLEIPILVPKALLMANALLRLQFFPANTLYGRLSWSPCPHLKSNHRLCRHSQIIHHLRRNRSFNCLVTP